MKNIFTSIAVCLLLVTFLVPTQNLTAATVGNDNSAQAVTQEPAEVAKLVIEGPTSAKIGDLVVISVAQSQAASFKWVLLPSTDNFLVIDKGSRLVFSSGVAGEFKFIVACSLDNTCDVAVHTVVIEGGASAPTNPLKYKIAAYCKNVVSDTKRDDCIKLAQSFASIAMVMEGGTLTTPEDIVRATFKSNQEALGDKLEAWLPFRNGLSYELKALADRGELSDTASHVRVWKMIAAALRDYAETL